MIARGKPPWYGCIAVFVSAESRYRFEPDFIYAQRISKYGRRIVSRKGIITKEVFNMKTKEFFNTKNLVILGLMTALVLIFSLTPIGSIPVGPLVITLNIIPVAIAAVACGPLGGAVIGGVFGLMSFLQCIGVGVPSGMGAALFAINPFLAFIQRFIPRLLDGIIAGYVFKGTSKAANKPVACGITGFSSAFFNTLLFMTSLVLLFGNTQYMKDLMGGKNVLLFIVVFVGWNALVEMAASTIITSVVGTALFKARLIPGQKKAAAKA